MALTPPSLATSPVERAAEAALEKIHRAKNGKGNSEQWEAHVESGVRAVEQELGKRIWHVVDSPEDPVGPALAEIIAEAQNARDFGTAGMNGKPR
jgi:hypothetical protein